MRAVLLTLLPALVFGWLARAHGAQEAPAVAPDTPAAPSAAPLSVGGTAQPAYTVLAKSCAPCHSDQLRRPKGKFGFVLDLRRLSRAGEYVVRGEPDASGLMQVIEDHSMPPPRSTYPPLTDSERAAIRDWILDGAPPGPIDPSVLGDLPELEPVSAAVQYAGHLHPLLIHFPIGLLVAAALAELLFVLSGEPRFRAAAEYCLLVGTLGACAATLSGWYFATDLEYTMTAHRWLGVATNLFALAACQLAVRVRKLPSSEAPTRAYRAAFAITILLLVVTSHLGGSATWVDLAFSG